MHPTIHPPMSGVGLQLAKGYLSQGRMRTISEKIGFWTESVLDPLDARAKRTGGGGYYKDEAGAE